MPSFSSAHKRFVVQQLACFRTPTEVAKDVFQEFGLRVERQQVHRYDPTKAAGKNLSEKLRVLFAETRQRFAERSDDIAISLRTFRLRELLELYRKAKEKGDAVLAATLLEQAAKESGGMFTNRRELTGADGGPVAGVFELVVVDPAADDGPA